MKYNRAEIMKRAWEIKKEDPRNIWSLCLQMAWAEAKLQSQFETLKAQFANGIRERKFRKCSQYLTRYGKFLTRQQERELRTMLERAI